MGQAADMLNASVDTLRRWEAEGRLSMTRSRGGQRLIAIEDVLRLMRERRLANPDRMIVAQSARNRFPGVVSKVVRDGVSAVVEVVAGPHRLVSLMTAEAAEELGLAEGVEVIGIVKATDVMIQIPQEAPPR